MTLAENPRILIVDDEPSILLTLETGLSLKGFKTSSASSGTEAISLLNAEKFDGVLCDVVMPDGDGLSVVRTLREFDRDLPVIMMTAQGSVETAFASLNEGATDFIAKPFDVSAVDALLRLHLNARRERGSKTSRSPDDLPNELSKTGIIGRSAAMVNVYKLITLAARTDATVLVVGESGTGKELVAHAIHDLSDRSKQKFVSVNCSGLTDTLLEAELFGYTKGSFTGATSAHAGLFEAAHGGTIFLDEIGSTSPGFQASLLRALQSGEVRRVGSTESRRVDVRVIAASNENLTDAVKLGRFRADLFYRLNVLAIELPRLSERKGDIPLLVNHFLRMLTGGKEMPISEDAWNALSGYDFPGNVRELENTMIRATALATGGIITMHCLPSTIARVGSGSRVFREQELLDSLALDRPTMEELQRRYLILVLEEVGANRRRAADKLGLDRRTIQRMIARYGLYARPDENDDELSDEAASD